MGANFKKFASLACFLAMLFSLSATAKSIGFGFAEYQQEDGINFLVIHTATRIQKQSVIFTQLSNENGKIQCCLRLHGYDFMLTGNSKNVTSSDGTLPVHMYRFKFSRSIQHAIGFVGLAAFNVKQIKSFTDSSLVINFQKKVERIIKCYGQEGINARFTGSEKDDLYFSLGYDIEKDPNEELICKVNYPEMP